MLKYTIQRLITFIPMLVAISLIAFIISVAAPADPVERLSKAAGTEGSADEQSSASKKIKQELRKKLGLDLPLFYISITDLASSDTLHKVEDKYQKNNLKALTHQSGNWQAVSNYYHALKKLEKNQKSLKIISSNENLIQITEVNNQFGFEIGSLLETSDNEIVNIKLSKMENLLTTNKFLAELEEDFEYVVNCYKKLDTESTRWKNLVPSISWFGFNNQYHVWLFGNGEDRKGVIRGDFGDSYIDGQPISEKIWDRIGISFALAVFSILIAYFISIPIGIYSAYKKDTLFDKGMSLVLFILYSMPSFFIGLLLLLAFANPDNLSWFPVSGIQDPSTFDANWKWWHWNAIKHRAPYLILPIITYTYGSFAFLSRIMRIGMIDIVSQDYIRTARAKGLGEKKVILKHALRNSLLPIITVFAAIFPSSIGGSVIIEVIFSIPGMGLEVYNSVLNYDYPMIVAVFTLVGFLTMVGYLISDILYAVVDPRISYK